MKYTEENRGKIQNKGQASRINDFSNLKFNKITPTDIDGFIDFGNKKFVFIETKHKGASLPYGQRLALARLCDACKVDSVVIVATHENTDGDINVGDSTVREYRYKRKWVVQFEKITVKEAVSRFINKA